MSDPKPLTRAELMQFLPSLRAVRAFEKLFDLVPGDLLTLSDTVTANELEGAEASARAAQALATLERIADSLERLETAPRAEPDILDDDLAVRDEIGTMGAQQSDDVDITGGAMDSVAVTNGSVDSALSDNTTNLLASSATLTNGAGAAAGTLSNAPAAGNPTKWVPIDDNGTTRYIPAW